MHHTHLRLRFVVLNVFTSVTELTAVARRGGAAVADGCMTEPRQNNKPGVSEPCTAALFTTSDKWRPNCGYLSYY